MILTECPHAFEISERGDAMITFRLIAKRAVQSRYIGILGDVALMNTFITIINRSRNFAEGQGLTQN